MIGVVRLFVHRRKGTESSKLRGFVLFVMTLLLGGVSGYYLAGAGLVLNLRHAEEGRWGKNRTEWGPSSWLNYMDWARELDAGQHKELARTHTPLTEHLAEAVGGYDDASFAEAVGQRWMRATALREYRAKFPESRNLDKAHYRFTVRARPAPKFSASTERMTAEAEAQEIYGTMAWTAFNEFADKLAVGYGLPVLGSGFLPRQKPLTGSRTGTPFSRARGPWFLPRQKRLPSPGTGNTVLM